MNTRLVIVDVKSLLDEETVLLPYKATLQQELPALLDCFSTFKIITADPRDLYLSFPLILTLSPDCA